ncbi:protein of unknown function [Cognatiyoonia sediminum]|uniref:DUF4856 domain-containing protein n=1 Tax=Cognatiyoonia sediminum TaxID=1508389 RepID=A0A1M5SS87_9RHOB|nr:DUF4856 domain-containing protein [Cognatiyoonia sediminum]SHH41158.1 protein of unknown function [Cognatiyoonia sediminum]
MLKSILKSTTIVASLAMAATAAMADGHAQTYGPFPITLQGYEGDKTDSTGYTGQIARHVLHDSLKKLAGQGDGGSNAEELEAQMLAYFSGSDEDLPIIAPATKGDFVVAQTMVGEISGGKNIEGKFYNGLMPAWPGAMSGVDVALNMISNAAASNAGFSPETGYDWGQLISKFTMGAMAYNQAVDNYLDEKLGADNKPNNAPYSDGAHYTGKEHSWDEAFGYFGAAAHTLALSADDAYAINKLSDFAVADANGDGAVDLRTEMVFGPAYYAASFDRAGTQSTDYLQTIMQAYIDGRNVITDANGEALTDDQRAQLVSLASTIEDNWEQVLAEAVFKYAGSVYKDINALAEAGDDNAEAYRTYAKHWGELKGFSMALQSGRNNLGETAVTMNDLILFGPPTLDNSYVTGFDSDGNFEMDRRITWNDYQLQLLQLQQLMVDKFGVQSRVNDQLADLEGLAESLGSASTAETD